jgi:hypothetical protein
LLAVPGVEPWHRRRSEVSCAASAAATVAGLLDDLDVPVRDVRRVGVDLAPTVTEPPPCMYEWAWGDFPRPYQRASALWLAHKGRAHLWAEPGAGKTWVALAWASLLDLPVLIVTLSSAVPSVADEARRFLSCPVVEWRPASRRRKRDADPIATLASGERCVVVVGWDILADVEKHLPPTLRAVVYDEADMARAWRRERWVLDGEGQLTAEALGSRSAAAGRLAARVPYVLTLTGTPLADSTADLWGILTLVEPTGWGRTARRFLLRYAGAEANPYGGLRVSKDRPTNVDELRDRISHTALRIPYDISHRDLPAKRRVLVRVPLEAQTKERRTYAREIKKADEAKDRESALFYRLAVAAERKRPALLEQVESFRRTGKGKAIVFTGTRKDAEEIGATLAKRGVAWTSHGDHDVDDRHAIRKEYMAHPGPCTLVVTWQAWGTAINLDDTDTVIFAQLPYSPRDVAQAEGRADRLSMTRPVVYVYLVAEATVDERVSSILLGKVGAAAEITPGSRLEAHGGVGRVLSGSEDVAALQAAMLERMENDLFMEDTDE